MQDNPFLSRHLAALADDVLANQMREYRRGCFDDSFTLRTVGQLRRALRALESEVERRQSVERSRELSRGN